MRVMAMVCAIVWVASAAAGAAETGEKMNAKLGTARGGKAELASFRGKPVILFFEDRDSPNVNKGFKDQLFRTARAQGLLQTAHVVAVANLKEFDFFPARQFALSAVREEERRWGIPILIDWKGALSKEPWSLPGKSSTVVLLDSEGRLLYARSGQLSASEQDRFFAELSRVLGIKVARQ